METMNELSAGAYVVPSVEPDQEQPKDSRGEWLKHSRWRIRVPRQQKKRGRALAMQLIFLRQHQFSVQWRG